MTGPNPDKLLDEDAIIFSYHARVRMFEKGVSTEDVISLLREGDVIEEYADDEPCPSFLLYGILNTIPYHLVVARCTDHLRVITVYIPDPDKWVNNRERRR